MSSIAFAGAAGGGIEGDGSTFTSSESSRAFSGGAGGGTGGGDRSTSSSGRLGKEGMVGNFSILSEVAPAECNNNSFVKRPAGMPLSARDNGSKNI